MRYLQSKRIACSTIIILFLIPLALSAQTLAQAEQLWKARRFKEANEVFKALEAREPKNPDYKVRWGRMMLDHAQPGDAQDLFGEALEIKKDHAGALMGMALVAAENFEGRARDLARKALESDPKLTEAQELLARLALEDNDNPKAIEEAHKALEMDPNSVQGKAILATIDLLADKKDSTWDPHTAKGYETIAHFFVLNRRYVEGIAYYRKAIEMDPQLYSARSQMGVNLMRLGQNEEAYKQLEICYNNDFQDAATRNSLKLMDSYKNFVTFTTPRTILKLHKKEAELLRPYIESEMERAISVYEKKYKLKLDKPIQLLFGGTEFGLFISIDGGATWARVTSLPRVAVHDVAIHPRDNDLIVATHGRGIQILDDITPLRALSPATLDKAVAVLPSRPAVQSVIATLQDFPGDAEYVGPNAPDGAYIAYYLKERHVFGTLKVEVLDANGKVIQSLAPGTRQGINRIFWNMRLQAPKSAAAPGLGARALAGPMVPEGKYTIRVTKDDQVATGTLELQPDPLGAHPAAARAERQTLLMRLYGMQADLAYVADAATDVRDKLRAVAAGLTKKDSTSAAAADAEALALDLDSLHQTLVDRTGLATAANPQLREHVIDLYSSVLSYGGAPTTSQARYADVLTNQLQAKRQKFDELTGSRLAAVNTKITAAGGTPIKAMSREEFDSRK